MSEREQVKGFARAISEAQERGEHRCSICLSTSHSTDGHPQKEVTPEERAYQRGFDAAKGKLVKLTGYELAGCADRAGLIVCKHKYPDMVAEDWERFAAAVCALRPVGDGK